MAIDGELVIIGTDTSVVEDMLGFGADSLRKCYQCGTCSVICPRTPLDAAFPRKEMVWAQWGQKDKLLSDGDAWLCYQCNDCITHCPVDARPGDVMAATRNLQITSYAVPRFMGKVASEPRFMPLAFAIPMAVVALMVIVGVLPRHNFFPGGAVLFEKFIAHRYIDIFSLVLIFGVFGVASIGWRKFWFAINEGGPQVAKAKPFVRSFIAVAKDIMTHKDFDDCTTTHSRKYAHLGIFFGFLMLVAATTGAFVYTVVLPALGIHWHQGKLSLPLWDPVKIIGDVGGLALIIGATWAIYARIRDRKQMGAAVYFDWFFVALVYITAITGFGLEALRFAQLREAAYTLYLVHLVFIYGLFAYFPYSKFAHVVYRTLAQTHAKMIGRAAPGKNGQAAAAIPGVLPVGSAARS